MLLHDGIGVVVSVFGQLNTVELLDLGHHFENFWDGLLALEHDLQLLRVVGEDVAIPQWKADGVTDVERARSDRSIPSIA